MRRISILVAVIAIAAALPMIASTYAISFLVQTLIFMTLAYSWNLIGGYAGYTHFGQVAFFGLGAYVTALAIQAGAPWPLAA